MDGSGTWTAANLGVTGRLAEGAVGPWGPRRNGSSRWRRNAGYPGAKLSTPATGRPRRPEGQGLTLGAPPGSGPSTFRGGRQGLPGRDERRCPTSRRGLTNAPGPRRVGNLDSSRGHDRLPYLAKNLPPARRTAPRRRGRDQSSCGDSKACGSGWGSTFGPKTSVENSGAGFPFGPRTMGRDEGS